MHNMNISGTINDIEYLESPEGTATAKLIISPHGLYKNLLYKTITYETGSNFESAFLCAVDLHSRTGRKGGPLCQYWGDKLAVFYGGLHWGAKVNESSEQETPGPA